MIGEVLIKNGVIKAFFNLKIWEFYFSLVNRVLITMVFEKTVFSIATPKGLTFLYFCNDESTKNICLLFCFIL